MMTENIQKNIENTLARFDELIQNSTLLTPLKDVLKIETAVVGGAIRDSILNKPIKDIDIYLHLNYFHNLNIVYPKRLPGFVGDEIFEDQILEASYLEKRDFQITQILENNSIYDFLKPKISNFNSENIVKATTNHKLIWILEEIISDSANYNIEMSYKNDETMPMNNSQKVKEIAYSSNGLNAVLCLKDKTHSYPIEILITTDYLSFFLEKFDFNICKVAMVKKDNDYTLHTTKEFLEDVKNRTITYQPVSSVIESNIEKSLSLRYPRLLNKYADYDLIFNTKNITNEEIKNLIENKVKVISNYNKLTKLKTKDNKTKAKTSKI